MKRPGYTPQEWKGKRKEHTAELEAANIRLKELDRLKSMFIASMSVVKKEEMVGDKEKALAAGCTGYIEKPIDPETFIADIEKYL